MLFTGGLNRFALLGTHKSASALRLNPVYGQRDFGVGNRMKIGVIGGRPPDCASKCAVILCLVCACLATILWPVEVLGNAATKLGLSVYSGMESCRCSCPCCRVGSSLLFDSQRTLPPLMALVLLARKQKILTAGCRLLMVKSYFLIASRDVTSGKLSMASRFAASSMCV